MRVHLAERVLVTWLVLDTSPSMRFGTADRRKADVAEGVAIAIGHVATRRGNRLGVVTFGDADPRTIPPKQGRVGLLGLLAALRAEERGRGPPGRAPRRSARRWPGPGRSRASARSSSSSPTSAARSTGAGRCSSLAGGHDVLAVEIRDPREQELPNAGELWLVDPETGQAAARRHAEREAPRPVRRGRRRGAERPRADTRLARACATSCSPPRATGSARSRSSSRGRAGELPVAALAARPADRSPARRSGTSCASAGASRTPRASGTRRCSRTSSTARPGIRRHLPVAVLLVAFSAMVVGVARPHATVSVRREEATVMLAVDVSRSMQRERRQADAPRRRAGGRRGVRCQGAGEVPGRARLLRSSRPVGAAADDRPLARPHGARLARTERGHGARRRRGALDAARAAPAREGRVGAARGGARDLRRRSRTAASRRRPPRRRRPRRRTFPSPRSSSARRTARSSRSSPAATRRRSRCRRTPPTCRRSPQTTGGQFFTAASDSGVSDVYKRSARGSATARSTAR